MQTSCKIIPCETEKKITSAKPFCDDYHRRTIKAGPAVARALQATIILIMICIHLQAMFNEYFINNVYTSYPFRFVYLLMTEFAVKSVAFHHSIHQLTIIPNV